MADREQAGAADDGLRGIGGWLLLLIVVMTVLTPVAVLWSTLRAAGAPAASGIAGGPALIWVVAALQAAAFLGGGLRLATVRRWSSVRLAIAAWWLGGPALTVGYALAMLAATGGGASLLPFVVEALRTAIVAGAWTAYLLRSARVRNTYPPSA